MLGRKHLKYLIHKGSTIIDILTSLAGTWWGSHPHLLLNLYRSIFRGSIEYGCHIFRFNLNKTTFAKLERLQYRAIRVGYRISTPINVMLFKSKEIPLKLRFISLMRKFFTKSLEKTRKFNPVIESLETIKNASSSRKARIYLLRSFPIFKQYIFIYHYRNIIHCTPFLPYFFFDFDTALIVIEPCMNIFPVNENLSNIAINKIFL